MILPMRMNYEEPEIRRRDEKGNSKTGAQSSAQSPSCEFSIRAGIRNDVGQQSGQSPVRCFRVIHGLCGCASRGERKITELRRIYMADVQYGTSGDSGSNGTSGTPQIFRDVITGKNVKPRKPGPSVGQVEDFTQSSPMSVAANAPAPDAVDPSSVQPPDFR